MRFARITAPEIEATARKATRTAVKAVLVGTACAMLLGGCGLFSDDDTLPGERIDIRPDVDQVAPATAQQAPLPDVNRNADWTQTNGISSHNSGNLDGPTSLGLAWTADVGAGDSSAGRITSAPIVVGGAVYAMDSRSMLSSFDASSGNRRWSIDLSPENEDGKDGFGGGLAADGGLIFATTGFGEVLGISPASGEILWRQAFGAPFRAAPAALNGLVVAVTRDNTAVALDGKDGALRWRMRGAVSGAAYLGGASPAIIGPITILPFSSGELVAAEARTGRRGWSAVLSGGRKGLARAAITDVSGDPVVLGPYVVAANQSGRMLAVDARTGLRAWTRNIGSTGPLWAAGDTLFVVSDDAKVMRISARDGTTLWEDQLPAFGNPEKLKDAIIYSHPVLVNGRLIFTDSKGNLFNYDALTGTGSATAKISGGSITGPVVANGMVFVLSDSGTLHAFR